MARFVLIPGAGGMAWYWHRLAPLLETAGHEVIAIDLPADDPALGLDEYASRVIAAVSGRSGVTLVAQSLGGFTAAVVAAKVAIERLVLVNAMIPVPGEQVGAWGEATGSSAARQEAARQRGYSTEFDLATYFFHDLPQDVIAAGADHERDQSDTVFGCIAAFDRWPDVPIHVIAGRDDRLFPFEFQRRVARERLGLEVDEVPGGHLCALSHPGELAERLLGYVG